MKKLGHVAISASAGSGKTFQLSHRYIRLLAEGISPDRICALTFSRKAAGEIFDSIVGYLCEAAASRDGACDTAMRIENSGFRQRDFLGVLRDFVTNLHRIHVGTLDSFIIGVVRTFPAELGIASNFRIMDNGGSAATELREKTLARIFDPRMVDAKTPRGFLEAFKRATFGQEEKVLGQKLNDFIEKNRDHFLVLPREDAWGNLARIWPNGLAWGTSGQPGEKDAAELLEMLEGDGLPERIINRWRTFTDAVRAFGIGSPWSREIEYLFEKLIPVVGALEEGNASISMERKNCDLNPEECGLVLGLVRYIMSAEMEAALRRTKGIHSVLAQYEAVYDSRMRTLGHLTFSDAQYLLTGANGYSGGALMSRNANESGRLYIDYRLDCRLDHWLLDEFQDTSDLQWAVLSNLADEVLQDDAGQRTFFYVGDVKQAIYGWRGGNARLFGNILKRYGPRIEERPLSVSFRSCRPVIDTVNRVFGDLTTEYGLPEGAVEAWRGVWRDHCSANRIADQAGYTALLEPAYDGKRKPDQKDRCGVVASLLKQIDPLKRGLDVAILVRSNNAGHSVVDYLRGECPGMAIVHEGNATILDNPAVSILLSLVKLAAHPGDLLAWRHLQMSPLSSTAAFKRATRSGLSLLLLRGIHQHGFQHTIRHWGKLLSEACDLDPFGRARLGELMAAAAEFDSTGNRDCDSFLLHASSYEVRELAAASAVRVMTIHQSKGLGFDMVILPDLMSKQSMARASDVGFVMAHDEVTEEPLWTLSMPRRLVSENDGALGKQIALRDSTECSDALCVLYVAMTRARRGLYMITSYPGKSSTLLNEAALLKTVLADGPRRTDGLCNTVPDCKSVCLYENGKRNWYEDVGKAKIVVQQQLRRIPRGFPERESARVRLLRVEPSAEKEVISSAAQLFAPEMRDILGFGSAIHALFEDVEWYDTSDLEAIAEKWRARSNDLPTVQQEICEQFLRAIAVKEVRRELTRPDGDVVLWREKSFEVVLDARWVTGQFDRVTIVNDDAGRPVSAVILDYKSNRVESEEQFRETVKEYRPQLALYSRALSRILKIPETRIARRLLFTRTGRIADV